MNRSVVLSVNSIALPNPGPSTDDDAIRLCSAPPPSVCHDLLTITMVYAMVDSRPVAGTFISSSMRAITEPSLKISFSSVEKHIARLALSDNEMDFRR